MNDWKNSSSIIIINVLIVLQMEKYLLRQQPKSQQKYHFGKMWLLNMTHKKNGLENRLMNRIKK